MDNRLIHINGTVYNAVKVVAEMQSATEKWRLNGWEFLIQLMDASEFPVKFRTSGTTGTPKEISFSKKQIWYSAKNNCEFFGLNNNSIMLLCLPLDFVAGRMMMARAIHAKSDLIWVEPSLNPLEGISKISFAAFTPAQVSTIIKNENSKRIFEKIDTVIIGGGEISPSLEHQLRQFPNTIYATYGMTETLTHIAVRKIGEKVYRSVYKDIEFSINNDNCLEIDLPVILPEKITTKDIVELVDKNSFTWKGRLDNVVNSGGVKIYAEDIEQRIVEAGLLEQGVFYITSQKDDVFGDVPVIVMLNDAVEADVAVLLTSINGVLNKHEQVKGVYFFDKFELTPTGKLRRQKL